MVSFLAQRIEGARLHHFDSERDRLFRKTIQESMS